jgi:hypothetical protein
MRLPKTEETRARIQLFVRLNPGCIIADVIQDLRDADLFFWKNAKQARLSIRHMIKKKLIDVVGVNRRHLLLFPSDKRSSLRKVERQLLAVVKESPGIPIRSAVSKIEWKGTWRSYESAICSVDYLVRAGSIPVYSKIAGTKRGPRIELYAE